MRPSTPHARRFNFTSTSSLVRHQRSIPDEHSVESACSVLALVVGARSAVHCKHPWRTEISICLRRASLRLNRPRHGSMTGSREPTQKPGPSSQVGLLDHFHWFSLSAPINLFNLDRASWLLLVSAPTPIPPFFLDGHGSWVEQGGLPDLRLVGDGRLEVRETWRGGGDSGRFVSPSCVVSSLCSSTSRGQSPPCLGRHDVNSTPWPIHGPSKRP